MFNDLNEKLIIFKYNLFKYKKYWIIYLILLLFSLLSVMSIDNYFHPKMEIGIFILLFIVGVVCFNYYCSHNEETELYKSAFIIIFVFGVLCCFLNPIMCTPDEIEHFTRAEITSRGELFPIYENGSYLTIQSTFDLIEKGLVISPDGYYGMNYYNSSIFFTDADTNPINFTLVPHNSAFAQNPFYGYIFPAIGIVIAKILDLNSIWLLWLGRIFNTLLYASLISLSIKKSPILKMPLFVFSCIPLTFYLSASVSIDALINGLGILTISYYFYLLYLPNNSLNIKHILKFTLLVLILGTCKITFFAFIFLLLCIPINNYQMEKKYVFIILSILTIIIFAFLWSKYITQLNLNSWRYFYSLKHHVNNTEQISYILSHKKEFLMKILTIPSNLGHDFSLIHFADFSFWENFKSIYLLFLGAVMFIYPRNKFNVKSRVGALLVCLLIYFGTYIVFMLTWNSVGVIDFFGVQPRYFLPMWVLLPFIFGFNNNVLENSKIDNYCILLTISFISMMILSLVCAFY